MIETPPQPSSLADRRARLMGMLPPRCAAVIPSTADICYLTSHHSPGAVLVLHPASPDPGQQATLFLPETSPADTLWEGPVPDCFASLRQSGITTVQPIAALARALSRLATRCESIAFQMPENQPSAADASRHILTLVREQLPLHRIERLAPALARLRSQKDTAEIAAIRQANSLAGQAFRRLLGFTRPGITEYQAVAELQHELLMARSRGFGCPPIAATGANAVALHYTRCRDTCQDGDLLLTDFTVEWQHYHADIARTIPVNGRYTARQRALCLAVLHIQDAAIRALRPGRTLTDCTAETAAAAVEELHRLQLISPSSEPPLTIFRRWCPHSLYHHIGLEVHDPDPDLPLTPGAVLTAEPGLYLPGEHTGIRMENNILITADGPEDLSAGIPRHPDEIEDLMRV